MTSNKDVQNKETGNKKRISISLKMIIFLILVLLLVLTTFYFYYKDVQTKKSEYDSNLKQIKILQAEKERCSNVISQKSGNFGDYEYCRQLLEVFRK